MTSADLLKERLNLAIEQAKVTNAAIADACDVTPQAVTSWRQTGRIRMDRLPALSKMLGKPIAYWFGDEPVQTVSVPAYEVEAVEGGENFDPDTEVWVDSIEIEASTGSGVVVPEFVPTKHRQRYSLRWFREMGARPQDVKVMGVRGESMEPTIYARDRVAINTAENTIVSGKVYAIVVAGEARIKRLFKTADGRIRIVSDNQDKTRYPDEYVDRDTKGFAVIGRVIERKGSGGL